VVVDDEQLEQRRVGFEPLPARYTRGVLWKYAKTVSSASVGATTGV
jgi:dihydroxy-acid dehydratase